MGYAVLYHQLIKTWFMFDLKLRKVVIPLPAWRKKCVFGNMHSIWWLLPYVMFHVYISKRWSVNNSTFQKGIDFIVNMYSSSQPSNSLQLCFRIPDHFLMIFRAIFECKFSVLCTRLRCLDPKIFYSLCCGRRLLRSEYGFRLPLRSLEACT